MTESGEAYMQVPKITHRTPTIKVRFLWVWASVRTRVTTNATNANSPNRIFNAFSWKRTEKQELQKSSWQSSNNTHRPSRCQLKHNWFINMVTKLRVEILEMGVSLQFHLHYITISPHGVGKIDQTCWPDPESNTGQSQVEKNYPHLNGWS